MSAGALSIIGGSILAGLAASWFAELLDAVAAFWPEELVVVRGSGADSVVCKVTGGMH